MENEIGYTELAKELGIKPKDRAQVLKDHLREEDWSKGAKGKIFLTEEGAERLRFYAAEGPENPQVVQYFKEFPVERFVTSNRWVMIKVPDGDGGYKAAPCVIPPRLHPLMRRGKVIRVEVIEDGTGETSYRHEHLAR